MLLQWAQESLNTAAHTAQCQSQAPEQVKYAIEQCIEKASSLLGQNITDDSLYLLFEWHPGGLNTETNQLTDAELTIVVTDSTKTLDAPAAVKCQFMPTADDGRESDTAEQIQYWIRDYLTTCASFMQYSLVAAFHYEGRGYCVLL